MIYINEDDVIHPWSKSGLQVFSQYNKEFASSFTYLLSPAVYQTAPKLSGIKSGTQVGLAKTVYLCVMKIWGLGWASSAPGNDSVMGLEAWSLTCCCWIIIWDSDGCHLKYLCVVYSCRLVWASC